MPNMTIYPYLLDGACWVFDDERHGLKEEAFVLGLSEIIARVVAEKPVAEAARVFSLTFGPDATDHDVQLHWIPPAEAAAARSYALDWLPHAGNWYRGSIYGQDMVGWLCPALFLYFPEAPRTIYAKAEPLPAGFDPIWHVAADDPRARRFVSAPGASRRGKRQ